MASASDLLAGAVGQLLTQLPGQPSPNPTASCVFVEIGQPPELYALAAAHSLTKPTGEPLPPEDVTLSFGNARRSVEIIARGDHPDFPTRSPQPLPDLAVLRLQLARPPGLYPLRLEPRDLDYLLNYNVALIVAGFPRNTEWSIIQLTLSSLDPRTRTFQVSNQAEVGMSGGPVVLADRPERLVGLVSAITSSPPRTFATPITSLKDLVEFRHITSLIRAFDEIEIASEPTYRQLSSLPDPFENRETEVSQILLFLNSRRTSGGHRALYLAGPAGVGKTVLVRKCIEEVQKRNRFETVLWYRIPVGSPNPWPKIFYRMLRHLGHGDRDLAQWTDVEKRNRLTSDLTSANVLTVFDGMGEAHIRSSKQSSNFRDPGVSKLLHECHNWTEARLIVTSRHQLVGYRSPRGFTTLALSNFDDNAAVEYMRSSGILGSEDDIRSAAKGLDNNPGQLRILADHLRKNQNSRIDGVLR